MMETDTNVINATRAAFEDLLDEGPLAPDWERASGQIVPVPVGDRQLRRAYRGVHPLAAATAVVVVLVGASLIFLGGRWEASDQGDAAAVGRGEASDQNDTAAVGIEENVCDLFTEEEVTGFVKDAYVAVGISGGESSMLLLDDTLVESARGYGGCRWHAAATSDGWKSSVDLERVQFYQTRNDRTFEADEAMPAGVEVANVLVRPSFGGMLWTSVDLQIVEDAPQWWRFSMVTEWNDLAHYTSFVTRDHRLIAHDLAFDVARQMFESITWDS